jgi:hypothetical protein
MIALLDDIVVMHVAGPGDTTKTADGPPSPPHTSTSSSEVTTPGYAKQRHDAHELSVMRAFHSALRSRPRLLEAAATLLDECSFTETRSHYGRIVWTIAFLHMDGSEKGPELRRGFPETELMVWTHISSRK